MTEEDSEIRLVKDEPKVVFKRFKNNLLDNLPADKPEFIKLLEKKDIVGEKSRRKLNTPNQKRIVYAGCVLQEIDTLEFSDEKFYKLLSIMKEYNNGLQTLVQEIEAYLDPVGGHFECMAMHHYLFKNNFSLEQLPYDKIQYDLITHDVIASGEEILNIGFKVIENIQRDLYHNQANKFKVFLQIMEDSDVLLLQNTAKRLGGSQRITEDLPAPNNVRATALSDSSVEVTWDQLSEATEYTIFYKIPFLFNFSRRSDDSKTVKGDSTTNYILTNLEGNTPYIINVQATGSNGRKSALSNEVSIRTAIPLPKPGDKRKDAPSDSKNDDFNCSAAADALKKQLGTLTRLNYNAMMGSLYAKDVITNEQRKLIDAKIGEEKMMYLIVDIIIPSLKVNNYKKYKGFLEAMEESEDSDLKSTAKRLGGSVSVPDS